MPQELAKFGRNLHIALYDKKMTKKELAEQVGVTYQAISAYTTGAKAPSAETLIKISRALGVTVDSLIG